MIDTLSVSTFSLHTCTPRTRGSLRSLAVLAVHSNPPSTPGPDLSTFDDCHDRPALTVVIPDLKYKGEGVGLRTPPLTWVSLWVSSRLRSGFSTGPPARHLQPDRDVGQDGRRRRTTNGERRLGPDPRTRSRTFTWTLSSTTEVPFSRVSVS